MNDGLRISFQSQDKTRHLESLKDTEDDDEETKGLSLWWLSSEALWVRINSLLVFIQRSKCDLSHVYILRFMFCICFFLFFSCFSLRFFQYRLGGLVSPTKRYKRIPLSLSLRKKASVFYLQFSFVVVVSNASACKLSSVQVIPITSKVVFLKARTTTM